MTDQNLIKQLWAEVSEDCPDKSIEFLFQLVCDKYRSSTGKEIDHGDVAEALQP